MSSSESRVLSPAPLQRLSSVRQLGEPSREPGGAGGGGGVGGMGEGGPGWALQAGEGADLLETAPALETAPSGMSSCPRVTLTSSQVRARMCFSGRTRQQKLDTRHTPTLLSASRQGSILLPGSISTHVLNLSLSLPPPPSPFLPLPPFLWPSLPRSLSLT